MKFVNKNYYELLDITPSASEDDVKRAYRMVRGTWKPGSIAIYSLYTPDESEAIAHKLEEAFQILSNPERRASYDRYLHFVDSASKSRAPGEFWDVVHGIEIPAEKQDILDDVSDLLAEAPPEEEPVEEDIVLEATGDGSRFEVSTRELEPQTGEASSRSGYDLDRGGASGPGAYASSSSSPYAASSSASYASSDVSSPSSTPGISRASTPGSSRASTPDSSRASNLPASSSDLRRKSDTLAPGTSPSSRVGRRRRGVPAAPAAPPAPTRAGTTTWTAPDEGDGETEELRSRPAPRPDASARRKRRPAEEPKTSASESAFEATPSMAAGRSIADRSDEIQPAAMGWSRTRVKARTKLPPLPDRPISAEMLAEAEAEHGLSGTFLRLVREYKGVSLQAISERTKVQCSYLRYLEEERYDSLPAAVYVEGFVTQVAKLLKLDVDRVVAEYMERFHYGTTKGSDEF